jgi:hypothetical protein
VCQPFKFQRLLKKFFYWPASNQLYGPPYMAGCLPAILSPKVAPTGLMTTTGSRKGVAAHLGWDTKPPFHVLIRVEQPFPELTNHTYIYIKS